MPAMIWVAKSFGEVLAAEKITNQKKRNIESTLATQTMLKAALPNAYQCGRCDHGPVLHSNCDDLRSHHLEVLPRGVVRNNACAKCGWFSENIGDWPRWDG